MEAKSSETGPASARRRVRRAITVFRNSYTRDGERRTVRKWSVKIQHQQVRRTVTLRARSKQEALVEARALREAVAAQGWEMALHEGAYQEAGPAGFSSRPTGEEQKRTPAYWRQRLIQRKYIEAARFSSGLEWSARIDHEGIHHYFPLGTAEQAPAAELALKIYRTVVEEGWKAARQRYAREFTVAVFWSHSPFTCTYTSLVTYPSSNLASARFDGERAEGRGRIVLIEPDPEVRVSLGFWLGRQPGWSCVQEFGDGRQALSQLEPGGCDLVLLNRSLPGLSCSEVMLRLKERFPGLPLFSTGIFEESDQIFMSVSGVRPGYFLQRRHPPELLDPIRAALERNQGSPEGLLAGMRAYFRNQFVLGEPPVEPEALRELTLREGEILNCLSKGLLDKEIAESLKISPWTVHNHLKRVFQKLRVHTRTEAVIKYLEK